MISEYLAQLKRDGYAAVTLVITKGWLEHCEKQTGRRLADLKAADLTGYQQSLRWQPNSQGKFYSENTANQAVGVVRGFYRWAAATGLKSTDPAAHLVTRRVPAKPRRELTTAEARKLLAQPNLKTFNGTRDRAILGLIIEHRTPFQAMANLDLGHFHYDMGALMVSGRRRGILSLTDGLADDLQRYLKDARPGVAKVAELALFVSREGSRTTPANFRAILERHAQAAGLSKHSFSS